MDDLRVNQEAVEEFRKPGAVLSFEFPPLPS